MLQASGRPSVCWKCLAHRQNGIRILNSIPASRRLDSLLKHPITTQSDASKDALGPSKIPPIASQPTPKPDHRPIRERLRDWAPDNLSSLPIQQLLPDINPHGKVTNSNTRPQSTGSAELDNFTLDIDGSADVVTEASGEDAELTIVGSNSRNPGDLVEMRQHGSRTPIFCIYLGYFGGRNHFYGSNGRWIISMGFTPLFTVSNFISPDELKPLLSMIPKDVTPDEFEMLRREDKGPSRNVAAPLIKKLTKFASDAEEVYQASLRNLDRARTLISDKRMPKYLSLFEIADILLPRSLKEGGKFPPAALYAVHAALHRNDFIFRPLSPSAACHRKDHLFEVFPLQDTLLISRVSSLVREYTVAKGKQPGPALPANLAGTALGDFVSKARQLVHESRSKRQWTPHGILSPSSAPTLETVEWSNSSKDIIRFLEWWASYDLFEGASRFHAYGSLILRSLDLYPDAVLDQSTAWTFLQEIGVIPSWEVPSRYKVRLPGTKIERGGGLIRDVPTKLEDSQRPDIAADSRKVWENDTVFCIDAPSTMLIDDGVSLGRTENPDEFWIHIHIADPASGILPKSELSHFMELIPENIYLPGHFQAMLPSDLGEEDSNDYKSQSLVNKYSLAPERPSLTFSAKVNKAGDLLDYKVEPGILRKVLYMDPQDVAKFCNEPPPPPCPWSDSLVVGIMPENTAPSPNRPMMAARDLDEASRQDLLVLYDLAEAIRKKRLDKGAWPFFFPRPSVTVTFDEATAGQSSPTNVKGGRLLPADPCIKIGYELSTGCSIVSNIMVLAGEIAARWSTDRGIPLPYRKDVHSSTNFETIYGYATKELYPLIKKGIEPKAEQRQELARLTGGVELSATPGPYFMLGLDMYAKATSPLRRFSDLIVHWQVHAALAHERQVQRPINPETDNLDDILPFTSKTIGQTLSLLQTREKMARAIAHGSRDWILIALVRAWRFETGFSRPLRFTVDSRWRFGLLGHVDFFGLEAIMDLDGIDGHVLIKDIRIGDQFDVQLADVNVHSRQIFVKATKYLPSGKTAIVNNAVHGITNAPPPPTS